MKTPDKCPCRMTGAAQVSWRNFSHQVICPERDSNPWGERLQSQIRHNSYPWPLAPHHYLNNVWKNIDKDKGLKGWLFWQPIKPNDTINNAINTIIAINIDKIITQTCVNDENHNQDSPLSIRVHGWHSV